MARLLRPLLPEGTALPPPSRAWAEIAFQAARSDRVTDAWARVTRGGVLPRLGRLDAAEALLTAVKPEATAAGRGRLCGALFDLLEAERRFGALGRDPALASRSP